MKWAFLIFLLGLDIVSKIFATQWLGIEIFRLSGITFSLDYVTNTGAAWGLFTGHSGLLFILRTAIILGLLWFVPKKFPIWLIVTGAVGNAIDYCLYGHVVDFLHFTFWNYSFPIFNVADSCITIGVLCLFLSQRSLKQPQSL